MRPVFGQRSLLKRLEVRIEYRAGSLAIFTPYDPTFVNSLKALIPASDRKWSTEDRAWLVSVQHALKVQELVQEHYDCFVDLPAQAHSPQAGPEMRLLEVRYLGAAKRREDSSETAYAWQGGGWNAVFPKSALMEWFGQTTRPEEARTLYAVLAVSQQATQVEIKAAWKRLARQWHPDVCREPDARGQFQRLQEAYEVLSDDGKRARYNAGLRLEASVTEQRPRNEEYAEAVAGWRAPLRCGLILCEGRASVGRFVVSKILQWADILDHRGWVLVTSWEAGAEKFSESWVQP